MERFCGALGRANLNPRFPFISMDRRVLKVAQLAQVKYMYHLFDALDLGEHKNATAKGVRYPGYPHSIFVRPRRVISADGPLARQLGAYLANLYDVDAKLVERRIRGHEFDVWGKMQLTIQSEGLDMITGYSLLPDSLAPCRDSTFVKVSPFSHIAETIINSHEYYSTSRNGTGLSADDRNMLPTALMLLAVSSIFSSLMLML
jgi:hypothetical protein